MLDYLNQTLGLKASIIPWAEAEKLPLYLRSGRKYSLLRFDNTDCILIEADENSFNLPAFRKQMSKLEAQPDHIVLCFKHLDSRQRKALIEVQMPFIVPGSQVYLPFLGTALQERMKSVKMPPKKLSPAAQLILLHFIYEPAGWTTRKVDLSQQLDLSAMNVTRAVQELTALELVSTERSGRCDHVSAVVGGKALYEKALPYMINPVQKRLYARKQEAFDRLPIAGEYALGARTLLNSPQIECKAVGRKEYKGLEGIEEVDPAWSNDQNYIQLEIWKYAPGALAAYNSVDIVSLALSLQDNKDERVEQAVEEMLEGYQW